MRLLLVVLTLSFAYSSHAKDDWKCPEESIAVYGYVFCEAEHAKFRADQADIQLNRVYKMLLRESSKKDKQLWINAQRAWLKSYQADCDALLSKLDNSPATEAELAYSCREKQIIQRTRKLERSCMTCRSSSPIIGL